MLKRCFSASSLRTLLAWQTELPWLRKRPHGVTE
ncbi:hypothetical protein QOZ95_000506 [Paenibacillus brasilensis]|uniref:Uncharacterized protein n=1 Tax=Paenibacillus brasilensis TaxID=128574 RepID=A0ABU0KSX0_9BACL|nr:hypothetical protein [Paenibacillus brasilensis]